MWSLCFACLATCLLLTSPPAVVLPQGLPLEGQEAEEFLLEARVIQTTSIPIGVTCPEKVTLTDDVLTLHAVWKTVDNFRIGPTWFEDGSFELNLRDSYKHEVAAYRLDQILQLGLVPPTVERKLRGRKGSLQLWVQGSITYAQYRANRTVPPNLEQWNQQMYNRRLLNQLTCNSDFNNVNNILVDPELRLHAIDHSRAFRVNKELLAGDDLTRFSRAVYERLKLLNQEMLEKELGRWLTSDQIATLLVRRDKIVDRANQLVREQGEDSVFFP